MCVSVIDLVVCMLPFLSVTRCSFACEEGHWTGFCGISDPTPHEHEKQQKTSIGNQVVCLPSKAVFAFERLRVAVQIGSALSSGDSI